MKAQTVFANESVSAVGSVAQKLLSQFNGVDCRPAEFK